MMPTMRRTPILRIEVKESGEPLDEPDHGIGEIESDSQAGRQKADN